MMDTIAWMYVAGFVGLIVGVLGGGYVAWKLDDGAYRAMYDVYCAERRARLDAEYQLHEEIMER